MSNIVKRFHIGEDFTEDEYNKWKDQLAWWIETAMPNIENPVEHAESMILACLNGTKLDGSIWPNVSHNFFKRIKQVSGFDLETGIGFRRPRSRLIGTKPKVTKEDLPPIKPIEVAKEQKKYKQDLLAKYPHLENPVYNPKVDELAETVIKSRTLSKEFMFATGKELERLSKLRESLHKQITELMELLEISPKYLLRKQTESETADVGSLIARLEAYGEVWQEYEKIDALRELLQKYRQLNQLRPDGTPQLNDWELWHQTRNRPIDFTCSCGLKWTLLGGFTPEEIEQALVQAYEVYGFGLEPIGKNIEESFETLEENEITET